MLRRKTKEKSKLDEAIDEIFSEMAGLTSDSDEYAAMADQLTKLYALKEIDRPQRVSPDAWAAVLGNLAGILVIVGYERTHVITSKALPFLRILR
jgi:hypothetical protein